MRPEPPAPAPHDHADQQPDGQTDQATKLMTDRIARALAGPKLSYPAATLATDRTRR